MKNVKAFVSATSLTIVVVGQIILSFVLYNENGSSLIRNAGWIILWISAVFGWLPILTLKKRGKPEGRGYIRTTVLVDRGVYAIVRHPQNGTAGILLNLALPLIGQHWLLVVLAATGIALLYLDTFRADEACIGKFGQEYVRYMRRVPRVNFLAGITRRLRHASAKSREA